MRDNDRPLAKTKATLLADNSSSPIVKDAVEALQHYRFADDSVQQLADTVTGILNDYAALHGKGIEVEYRVTKKLFSVNLKVYLPGERFSLFTNGNNARERFFHNLMNLNLNSETIHVSEWYVSGSNIISISMPLRLRAKKRLGDPMIWAIVLGILCGILCQHLPQEARSFIVDDLASPVMSTVLDVIAGIMGPVIFISLITSITAFNSIKEFTDMGFKVLGRFIQIALFLIAVSLAVAAVFFRSFGNADVSIVPDQIIKMLLDIIPTNIVKPFIDNNTPQLVILGLVFGLTLLMLEDRVKELEVILMQINECVMGTMSIILTIAPAIPFLSLMINIARGNIGEILAGWKYIVASYVAFTLSIAVKALKTSSITKIGIPELWRRMKPAVKLSFSTGSTSAATKMAYELSENAFGIKPEFTSFWIPMCSAMMSPKTTISLVLATCMMAQSTGLQISNSFLLVLILVALELSLASPGLTSALVIMFETLAIPTSYVGLFSAYRLLTENFNSGVVEAYCLLEELEAAHRLGGIRTDSEAQE